MTVPWAEAQIGDPSVQPIDVIITKDLTKSETPSQVYSYGFTISRTAADGPTAVLLEEDPLRIRALITTNLVFFIGDKKSMSNVQAVLPATGSGGPGIRIPTGLSSPFPIMGQNEMWAAFTGVTDVGVLIERRIPGGVK